MTYREVCKRFKDAGIDSPEWDAECLIRHYFSVTPIALRTETARDYSDPAFENAIRRRCAREPLQYILGEWEFYRQTYTVTPDCLIPRSDTEILVDEAIRLLPRNARFLDLCTGSGCIAVSVLAERTDTQAVALEKYPNTLKIAELNAQRNNVQARFSPICADVTKKPPAMPFSLFDAILSNPPYIATDVIKELSPEVRSEPIAALDGGEDGLLFYRAILGGYAPLLSPHGFFLFEIGYDQADALIRLGKAHGFINSRVLRDFGGNDRTVFLSRIPETTH